MQLDKEFLTEFKRLLTYCKQLGIESVVLSDGSAAGVDNGRVLAILTDVSFSSVLGTSRMGIGRVPELLKRLELFGSDFSAEISVGQKGDVSSITLLHKRSKTNFRCTSPSMMTYPKENEEVPKLVLTLSQDEASFIQRAIKSFASKSSAVFQINLEGVVRFECSDSNNDTFSIELEQPAEFVGEAERTIGSYSGEHLCVLLDVNKAAEKHTIHMGENGSLTCSPHGYTTILLPNMNEE